MVVVAWMAYAALLTLLLAVGGLLGEGIARACGAPRRFVWLVVLAGSVVAPPILAVRPHASHANVAPATQLGVNVRPSSSLSRSSPVSESATIAPMVNRQLAPPSRVRVDHYVVAAWAIASTILLTLFFIALVQLRIRSRTWSASIVDDTPVFVSRDVGPAVIGALWPRIVIAEWNLTLDDAKRALLLRHELEHIRARDPLFLRLATFALILCPWNVALWLVVRRLRQNIELDCDQRVLGVAPVNDDVARAYGLLLLLVGARRSTSRMLATSLAGDRPFLERRIRAMTTRRTRRPTLLSVGLIAVTAVAMLLTTFAPLPASLWPASGRTTRQSAPRIAVSSQQLPPATPQVVASNITQPAQRQLAVDSALATMQMVVDTDPPRTRDQSVVSGAPFELAMPQGRATSRPATGRVVDSATNTPLANVYVSVVGIQSLGEENWTCSDANGAFALRVPVGEAWVAAQAVDHSFARVVLRPSDSVAFIRGAHFDPPPTPMSNVDRITSLAVSRIQGRDPIIIIDGVRQDPQPGDFVHLTMHTANGGIVEQDWRRGEAPPKIIVDGKELPWERAAGYDNPCARS